MAWKFGLSTVPYSIDEIRLSSQLRSSDWLRASYENQSGQFDFPRWDSTGENAFTSASEFFLNAETYFEETMTQLAAQLPSLPPVCPAVLPLTPLMAIYRALRCGQEITMPKLKQLS